MGYNLYGAANVNTVMLLLLQFSLNSTGGMRIKKYNEDELKLLTNN